MAVARERLPGEIVFACLMLMLSAFLLWTSIGISGFKSATSAGSFPMAASATMLVCSLMVVAQTVRLPLAECRVGESVAVAFVRRIAPPVVVWTTLAVIAYMLLLEWLGFMVGSYLFLNLCTWILGGRRVLLNLMVSALSLAAVYVVFQTAFSVQLPAGSMWQGIFR